LVEPFKNRPLRQNGTEPIPVRAANVTAATFAAQVNNRRTPKRKRASIRCRRFLRHRVHRLCGGSFNGNGNFNHGNANGNHNRNR
jgi:hypothetical protein